jgi:hypothetical protein
MPGPSISPRAAEDDTADRGHEQDDRGHLEGEEVVGEEERADLRRRAEGLADIGGRAQRVVGLERDHDDHLEGDRAGGDDCGHRLERGPAGPGRVGASAEVGDDEEEHDDHGARVDEHLRRCDELGVEKQVEHGQRGQVPDKRERAVERVREEHDGEAAGEEGERRDDPDQPDEDVCGGGRQDDLRQDSAFQTGTGVS